LHVYCLFCRTQRCRIIAELLEIRGINRAFSPQIIRNHRKMGQNIEKRFDLLPGYVFFFHDEPIESYQLFEKGIDGIIRRIGRPDDEYELQGPDREFALRLYEKDGLVGVMKVLNVGDTVTLEDPLFEGCEGKITRIDYRKQRARVEFVFNNTACHTWIACDAVRDQSGPALPVTGEEADAVREAVGEAAAKPSSGKNDSHEPPFTEE